MIKLLEATEQDISRIQDMARRSWEHSYATILHSDQLEYMLNTMYSEKEIRTQLSNPNYHYYLLFNEAFNIFEGFIGYENAYEINTTKLHRIYLLPESKGKGSGKKALNFLHEKVKESGDNRVILAVNKNNSAKQFYESQGYKVYDEGIFDIGNGFVMDDYLMEIYL